ncbi:MAG: hypothetical protein ACE5EX_05645 [Phycisphaerae bacterium]
MDQRARLHRTLVVLAVSMTGTSALLGWMDPSPAEFPSLDRAAMNSLASSVVAEGPAASRHDWRGVDIVPAAVSAKGFLAAARDHDDCHFRVTADGRPESCDHWRRPASTFEPCSTLVIHVVRPGIDEPMTPVQRSAVRALIVSLRDGLDALPTELPAHLAGEWADPAIPSVDP